MSLVACIFGMVTVLSSSVLVVADRSAVSGALRPASVFTSPCGSVLQLSCRQPSGRTNWNTTVWSPTSQLDSATYQRDTDVQPVMMTSAWPVAYVYQTIQRSSVGAQSITLRATSGGCTDTWTIGFQP